MWSSIFRMSHHTPKNMRDQMKKGPDSSDLSQKKSECFDKNFAIMDVFLNLANFAQHALFTLAPPSSYALGCFEPKSTDEDVKS